MNKAYLLKFTCFLSITLLLYVVLLSTGYYEDSRVSKMRLTEQTHTAIYRLKPMDLSITYQMLTENSSFHILYLTQTEKCLPKYLKSPKVIGNRTACQCDVLVLSYKEECKDTSLPHVKYIFQPSTTWTSGRNLLYKISKARVKFYLYYIFMDDDIKLQPPKKTDNNPWRMFESSLKTIQPAIAVVDPYIKFHRLSQPKDCEPERVTKFAQVFWFDAMFNAFHCQAIDHILPYPTRFDKRSWYYSQMYAIIRSDIKFHGEVVCDTRIKARNTKHRPYPREHYWNTFTIVADDVRKEIPEKFRNRSEPLLGRKWMKKITQRMSPSDYYCSRTPKPNQLHLFTPFEGHRYN